MIHAKRSNINMATLFITYGLKDHFFRLYRIRGQMMIELRLLGSTLASAPDFGDDCSLEIKIILAAYIAFIPL